MLAVIASGSAGLVVIQYEGDGSCSYVIVIGEQFYELCRGSALRQTGYCTRVDDFIIRRHGSVRDIFPATDSQKGYLTLFSAQGVFIIIPVGRSEWNIK